MYIRSPMTSQAPLQCRENGKKPTLADISQYSDISRSVEWVSHQLRRCLIDSISWRQQDMKMSVHIFIWASVIIYIVL
jgi:hypothetical protein